MPSGSNHRSRLQLPRTARTPGSQHSQPPHGPVGPANARSRPYLLHVPADYDDTPRPLVLNLHGFLNDGEQQHAISRMAALSDEQGFVVARLGPLPQSISFFAPVLGVRTDELEASREVWSLLQRFSP